MNLATKQLHKHKLNKNKQTKTNPSDLRNRVYGTEVHTHTPPHAGIPYMSKNTPRRFVPKITS